MVSGSQPANSEVLGRGRRQVQPNDRYNSRDFVTSNNGGERTQGAQRGAQASGTARGGRGTNANVGSGRTRANSDLRTGNNASRRNSVTSENSESDSEEDDRQIAEVSESVSETKRLIERNEVYTITCLLALLRAYPASAVNKFKQDAMVNKDNENYTYVHNILAELEREGREMEVSNPSYADAVGTRPDPTDEVRSDSANVGTVTHAEVREFIRQEAPRVIEDSRRKKNIIILGMDEGYDERVQVEGMLREIECGSTISAISARPIRLGVSRRGRNRPIKVEFNDERAVKFIMDRKWNVRHTENFYNLFINRDLCKHDREQEKASRRQNRASRNSSGAGEANPNGGRGGEERGGGPDSRNLNRNDNGVANRNVNVVTQEPRETIEPSERENQNQTTEDQTGNQNTQSIQQNLPTPGTVQRSEIRAEGVEGGSIGNNVGRRDGEISRGATDQGLSEIVVTTPTTPMRQGIAEPRRNIASEGNGRRRAENGEQSSSISGNRRGQRTENGH